MMKQQSESRSTRLVQTLTALLIASSCYSWTTTTTTTTTTRITRTTRRSPQLESFSCSKFQIQQQPSSSRLVLSSSRKDDNDKGGNQAVLDDDDDDEPVFIEGSQFFGGNKQKVEFYDAEAEAQAGQELKKLQQQQQQLQQVLENSTITTTTTPPPPTTVSIYDNRVAFETDAIAELARHLQQQINAILYPQDKKKDDQKKGDNQLVYASNVQWETPIPRTNKSPNPLQELKDAKNFYRFVDLAITSGCRSSSVSSSSSSTTTVIEFRWELSVEWPIFWEPRVLITGTSQLHLKQQQQPQPQQSTTTTAFEITKQIDTLDDPNGLGSTLRSQLLPRFWDVYHIGMTPSAERSPRFKTKSETKSSNGYRLHQIPPRWMLRPTLLEKPSSNRDDATAAFLPNHSFSTVIKTMGPQKDRFVPTSPVQVKINILKEKENNREVRRQLEFSIPLSVEFLARQGHQLPIPIPDFTLEETDDPDTQPQCTYVWTGTSLNSSISQQQRLVATLPYGGGPQDAAITDLRKTLYERAITKDGWKAKLDDDDDDEARPSFVFWQHGTKACFTGDEGLGMAVYEWRATQAQSNEVGLEVLEE